MDSRIEKLDGWDANAEEILNDLAEVLNKNGHYYGLLIPISNNGTGISIIDTRKHQPICECTLGGGWRTPCEKLKNFKKVLYHLDERKNIFEANKYKKNKYKKLEMLKNQIEMILKEFKEN